MNLIKGLTYFLAGLQLITAPGLKRFVIIPLAINIILFIGLFFLARHFMGEFNAWFATFLPAWLHWLSAILWVLFFLSFFLLLVYTFVMLANFISAPFNSFLAEKVELHLTGKMLESRTLWENIKDIPRILGRQLAIIGYFLPRALALLLLFFVPGLQIFVPILWFLFHAWFMTLTYVDYPTDNHRVPMSQVRAWLREKPGITLGFGMGVLVFTMIPFLNFLAVPVAVAAATKLWVDEA